MVERLIENTPLDGNEPFLIYYGDFVNDLFCGKNYTCNDIGITLWHFLRQQQYQRIVFYEGANKLFCYDEHSLNLCRPESSSPGSSVPQTQTGPSLNKMAGGPMGKRNLVKTRPIQKQPDISPELPGSQLTQAVGVPSAEPRRSTSDIAALEILNYILLKDPAPISTALIFSHANDLDRQNLGGESTFRELTNRMVHWAQAKTTQPNVCIFIFQDTTCEALIDRCRRQELTVLTNFLERQKGNNPHVRHVGPPGDAEIIRLIHRNRLMHNLQVDWTLLPHIAKLLARQSLSIKPLWRKLEHTNRLTRETLLKWSREQFFQVKEHIIQNLGSNMQTVDTTEIFNKLSPVLGQQDNIELVVQEVGNWLSTPRKTKPLSLFMAGTSGVGKTYTVKLLAEALQTCGFDYCDFQMTEFSEEHRVSSLIGSPPGYIGSEEEPRLFKALKQSNRLVILFDEIEKAHDKVLKALMQLVEEGKLSWNGGQGDFRECIICFTSNKQMQEMVDLKYAAKKAGRSLEGSDFQNQIRDILVRASIAPEICGRINRFLIYNPLELDTTVLIADQQVHLLAVEYELEVQSIDQEFLAKTALASCGSTYGARPVQNHVRNALGDSMLTWLRDHPRNSRICIEKDDANGYTVGQALDVEPVDSAEEYETATQICQRLQRQERMIETDHLRKMLSQVYCQQDEIELLIREVSTWFAQVKKHRPLSLFLAGTSGVGKTYTCELLAKAMRAKGYDYVYFPMNQFSQENQVNTLIGSPTGFSGSDTTPKIFQALERSKRLVILFDEIEKAHETIPQAIMQLLDEGLLSWNKGDGDFRECILCFTSNAQRQELRSLKESYRRSGRNAGEMDFQKAVRDVLNRAGMAAEICGRINRFFVYNPLTPSAVFHIALAEIQKIALKYELEMVSCDPTLLAELALSTSGSEYGARPITREIENVLGQPLSQFKNRCPDSTHVICEKIVMDYTIVPADPDNICFDMEALMDDAQEVYEALKHDRAFVDREALSLALGQVKCQDDNIRELTERLDLWYSQEKKDRPLSFFLVGASGVGKTYTAEILAKAMLPYGYNYVEFNMNEYSQEASVNNLIGSPKGYVGSDEVPRLFAELEQSNRLIILMDEIEKAHSKVFVTMMELVNKGALAYSRGTCDFRECIVLFTSNAEMDAMIGLKAMFGEQNRPTTGVKFQNEVKNILIRHGRLPAELCGRINLFLVYNLLTLEATVHIVLQQIKKIFAGQGCQVGWVAPELLAETAQFTAGSSSGARAVRDEVEARLSQPLLRFRRDSPREKHLQIDYIGGEIEVTTMSEVPSIQIQAEGTQAEMIQQTVRLLSLEND